MSDSQVGRMTFLKSSLESLTESFLIERKSQELTPNSILYYRRETGYFLKWLGEHHVLTIGELTPEMIRLYLSDLGKHRNKGGCHASFRAIKAMLNFVEFEYEPEDWKNPIHKIKIQKNNIKPIPGVPMEDVERMIKLCNGRYATRDKAILACLVSSGCRASEFLALNIQDINFEFGSVTVWHGKGDKFRTTYINREGKHYLRKYLSLRLDQKPIDPLWLNYGDERLTVSGLRHMVLKYADLAGVKRPGLHDFRRTFAINLYRKGVEVLVISQLLGHSSVEITKRYLSLTDEDLRIAHSKGNPFE